MKHILLVLFLFFSSSLLGQSIQWTKNFDTSNLASPSLKIDSAGNGYLYNAIFTGANANIVKLDKDGNQSWVIKMTNKDAGLFYVPLFVTIDEAQNVYVLTTELEYTGFELEATNGSFHMGPTSYSSQQSLVVFKLDKDGKYLWSSTVSCNTATLSGITFDKYTNSVYPEAAYTMSLSSDASNLLSPATDNVDIAPVAFFWSIDGATGNTKAVNNLYLGYAGTIVPLSDRLAYFTSNKYIGDVAGNYLQLDYKGNIQKTKAISLSQLSQFQATDVSQAYYYDTGVTSDMSIVGYFDFRNRIRKFDLYGNPVVETDFSSFDTVRQQKTQAFSTTGIQSINDQNVLFYGANLNDFKTSFLGDSLAKYDFRLTFMDEKFNVNKNVKCKSTSYLVLNSFNYNATDSSFYVLLTGNQGNTVTIGSATINIPDHDVNVNYSYLVKLKFNDITLFDDKRPAIVNMVFDQQLKTASINDTLATVNSVALPGTNLTSLSPVFTLSAGARFKTQPPTLLDISKPLTMTLVNDQGIERDWTIKIIKTGNENNIDTVSFPLQLGYTRDTAKKVINVLVARTVDLHNTTFISFKADQYSTVSPDPSSIKDFSSPQIFNVTADNGDVAQWTVIVSRNLSSNNDILEIKLAGEIDSAHINDIDKIVTVQSKTLKTSIQSIGLSDGAVLVASIASTVDFSSPVTFQVKAENGDIANWLVKVSETSFSGLDVIDAYPIPAINILNVSLNVIPQTPASMTFSSAFGATLVSKNVDTTGSASFNIDVSKYLPGIYLLSITNNGHVYTKKIMVKH